jgi:signal transduction histidine kinase
LDDDATPGTLIPLRDIDLPTAADAELRMACQLRALHRVHRGMAHDLRGPLNAMVLNLELLRRSLDPAAPPRPGIGEKQQRWVGVIEQEVQRLRRALDVLLAQMAPPPEQSERFDLRGVVDEIAALLLPQVRHQQVTLEALLPDEPVPIHAQRDGVRQATLNLAINALEAMPGGGELRLALLREGGVAHIRISDTGAGIPAELQDRIFDFRFTTKPDGTGIGLYVARALLAPQGGSVRAAASGPRGTTFELTLPLPQEGS